MNRTIPGTHFPGLSGKKATGAFCLNLLTITRKELILAPLFPPAEVAELVDAADSKSVEGDTS